MVRGFISHATPEEQNQQGCVYGVCVCMCVCGSIDQSIYLSWGRERKIEIYFKSSALEIVGLTSTESTEQADTLETQERVAVAA